MRFDEISNPFSRDPVKQAEKRVNKEFQQKMKLVPKMTKDLTRRVSDAVVRQTQADPQADLSKVIPKLVNDFMRYKSYSAPEFTGDARNAKQLQKYVQDQIVKKYEEEVFGSARTGSGTQDQAPQDRDGDAKPAQQTGQLPSDVKQQLDALTPQQRQELLGALA